MRFFKYGFPSKPISQKEESKRRIKITYRIIRYIILLSCQVTFEYLILFFVE